MKIASLSVRDFRNLGSFDFQPCGGVNIIYGDNAQGKTNLLEAVWLFTGARSFRGTRDKDFIRRDSDLCSLLLGFEGEERDQSASLRYGEERREVMLNEIKQERPSALGGVFCAVLFSPDHMSLVKNGPEHRRKMIDVSLSQAYPKYAKALDNYSRALKQRNTLLKDISSNAQLLDMLDVWDKYVSDYGGYISALRAGYIRRLDEHSQIIYDGISGGREKLSISYLPGFSGFKDGTDRYECQRLLLEELLKSRGEDIRLGTTGAGPHRDDIDIKINDMSARAFGSQGQQRSCVLAIKLAECEILEQRNSEPPIVMLDDVMSELDESRRRYLLNHLNGKQVIITCCDTSAFGGMENGKVFEMKAGILSESGSLCGGE